MGSTLNHVVKTDDFPALFAAAVLERMRSTGTSELALHESTLIPRETLRRRLRGHAFRADEMAAVAAYFGTTVSELCEEAERLGEAA